MVKSRSCFRLITCGGDAAEKDDHQVVSEIRDSNDKRGWSFRKRSARHRVLSNTVITETPSSTNKESSECTSINFQSQADPIVVEKRYTANFSDEKPQLPTIASAEMLETVVTEAVDKVDVDPPESVVIIVQAAIRGFLAQRALLKSKKAVKLQAAVRGHLVRKHAVGTLRCVQAIVKMQLLVRARHAQQSHSEDHLNHKGNEHHVIKPNVTHTSVEKILSNKFARQLLESTPKDKPIHVKCDPSKADSAWKWLERWMSASSKDSAEQKNPICMPEQSDETNDSTHASQLETSIPSEASLHVADSKPTVGDSPLPPEDEEKTTNYDVNYFYSQTNPSTSSLLKDNVEQAPPEEMATDGVKESSIEIDSFQNKKVESEVSVPLEPSSPPKLEIDDEQCKQAMETFTSDPQLETEEKKFVRGSQKISNPAFIAAQSKFEELSSVANSGRSSSLSNQEASVVLLADTSSVVTDTACGSKEFFSSENSAPYPSIIGGSECSTEISISSTLDSRDRSQVGSMENGHDAKDSVEGIVNPENKIDHSIEANNLGMTPTSSLPITDSDQAEIVNDVTEHTINSVVLENSKETDVEPEKNASDSSRELTETVLQDFKSPEASPGSHLTIPESQGTPSSQVSVKSKESKINKRGSKNKRRILSVGSKSPAIANHDSGSRGSKEQLPKDQQNGKRRNSFGSVKPDHDDQEPRDSSNNNSIPHFMQATESARAKINANNSPRSSPDVHDQDGHIKKRHSLPGATGRQGSPCIQRPSKGTVVHASHERKWQR